MLNKLNTSIYADGADLDSMISLAKEDYIKGLTTNPTLMRAAGIDDYEKFAKNVLNKITTKPISFEVFSDDIDEMREQAKKISKWGSNVFVKIPVTNTHGKFTDDIVKSLSSDGIKLNVTAIFTINQVDKIFDAIDSNAHACLSVFAGRIADTGINPIPIMKETLNIIKSKPNVKLIWASPREVLNVIQASEINCDIITVTPDLLKKLNNLGYDLTSFSLDTVKMFRNDALKAGYVL